MKSMYGTLERRWVSDVKTEGGGGGHRGVGLAQGIALPLEMSGDS